MGSHSRPSWEGGRLPCLVVGGYFEGFLGRGLLFLRDWLLNCFGVFVGEESGSETEKVVIVVDDGGEGDAAGLDDVLAKELGGKVGEKVGAHFGDFFDAHGGGAGVGPETNGVGGDLFPLKGHGRLRGNDVAVFVQRDLKGGVIIGGEDSAQVVDAHGNEEAPIDHLGDFGLPGAVL